MAWDTDLLKRGYDLANPKITTEVIAPEVANAVSQAFKDASNAVDAVNSVFTTLQGAPSELTTIGSTVAAALGAVAAAKGILERTASRWDETSTKREMEARDRLFAERGSGEWQSRFKVEGPKPSDLDLKDNAFGWTAAQFLAQYRPPGLVFLRKARPDRLVATFPTYATDMGGFARLSDNGLTPDVVSSPDMNQRTDIWGLLDQRFAIPAVPEKYGWNYICDAPGANNVDAVDRVLSGMSCAPVPGSTLSMSWGTYPFLGPLGEAWPLGPQGVATCLAMQALTPVWAALKENGVEKSYRYWLEHSRIRELERNPKRQLEPWEMVLDSDLLPYSINEWGIPPYITDMPGIQLSTRRWAAVETSFRRFFALREMAIRQPELLPKSLQSMISANDDFKRKPRDGYSWADPLGDGWLGKPAPKLKGPSGLDSGKTPPKRVGRDPAIELAMRRRELVGVAAGAVAVTGTLGLLLWKRRSV